MIAASVNAALGRAGLLLMLAACVVGALTVLVGVRRGDKRLLQQGARYSWMALGGIVLAVVMMQRALITRDFSMAYIQQVGSADTPALYNIAAMWSALEGSILLWALILGGYTAAVAWRFRKRTNDVLVGWALIVMYVIAAFFAALSFGPADPFGAGAVGVTSGPGPNPLLQNHILVLFHPPILYLGYVGFAVPFAFAIAALVTGRLGEGWLMETRRWALFSWAFLTIGILLGGWWSYEVLGWSGVWAWDPVENASLLPWLTGTAYIHSVLVQERRGMLRVWNLSLLVATFSLTILGTFLTRSGVINSVHAFGDGPVGSWLLAFFAVIVIVSLGLIAWRGDRLRSPGSIDSPISREGAFLANNVVFTVFAFIVLLGTIFPLLVEAFQDRRTIVGRAVLRSAVDADRARLAVPDGRGAGPAVAQGIGRAAPPAVVLAGLDGCRSHGARRARRCRRLGATGRVRSRRVRRRVGGASARARHPPSGPPWPRRTSQRRHGRPHRRDSDRHRPRRLEQLHPFGHAGARGGRARSNGVGTRSNSRRSTSARTIARASACWRRTSSSTAVTRTARRPRPT